MKVSLLAMLMLLQGLVAFGQLCSQDSLVIRPIEADETDPLIDPSNRMHQIFVNNDCVPNDKLLVHLVGSFDNPNRTTFFPILAANNGFKVISLEYPNSVSAGGSCRLSSDIECYDKYRQEIVFGDDVSDVVEVDASNSIVNRLNKLLIHLDSLYPTESWNTYLSNTNEIDWSNLILSGHSQGGGHAAYLAKQFSVDRVLMFASPNDYSVFFSGPASWTSEENITPDSNYYAFGNLFDEISDYAHQYAIWSAMDLISVSDSILVDEAMCPFEDSNIIYTKDMSATGIAPFHSSMIIDNMTPLIAGVPVFLPVWEHMLGICEGMSSLSIAEESIPEVRVFPNPTSNQLFIKSDEIIVAVQIFNQAGNLIERMQMQNQFLELNTQSYQGLILLQVITKSGNSRATKVRLSN